MSDVPDRLTGIPARLSKVPITATDTAVGTIRNDDSAALSIADISADEGDGLTFTVTLNKGVQGGFTVTPKYTDGTAASTGAGADYTKNTATLTFAGTAGEQQTFTVATVENREPEPDETFTVGLTVSGTTLAVGAVDTATGTINNDDFVTVSVVSKNYGEGTGGLLELRLSSPVRSQTVDVAYATSVESGQTATSGTDFTAAAGTVRFSAGTVRAFVWLTTKEDTIVEANETFTMTASAPTGGFPAGISVSDSNGSAVVTIDDNDSAEIRYTATWEWRETETDVGVLWIVGANVFVNGTPARDSPSLYVDRPIPVGFRQSTKTGQTATVDKDFLLYDSKTETHKSPQTATIPAGGSSVPIEIVVVGDTIVEPEEWFEVELFEPSEGFPRGVSLGTPKTRRHAMIDDDTSSLSISDAEASEGDYVTFTVTLNEGVQGGLNVALVYTDGTAVSTGDDADYTQNTVPVTFDGTPGEMKVISVLTTENYLQEDDKTFTVGLETSGATEDILSRVDASATATGTILNDDKVGVRVSKKSIEVKEAGDGNLAGYSVVLTAQPTADVTVSVMSSDTSAATVDKSILTFTPQNWYTQQTVTVSGVNDDFAGDRTVTITHGVSGPGSGYEDEIANPVTVMVRDDDGSRISIRGRSFTEGLDRVVPTVMIVSLSRAALVPITVNYATSVESGQTATSGTDFTAVSSGTITIPAGRVRAQGQLTIVDDEVVEGAETFTVTLSAPEGGFPAGVFLDSSKSVTVTILDDDSSVLSIDDVSATEGGDLSFTVTADKAVQGGFTVTPKYTDGTAASTGDGADYTQNTTALAFTGTAEETKTFMVSTAEDAVIEADETFTVSLSVTGAPQRAQDETVAVDATATATGTITDDDGGATLSIKDVSADEGDTLTFTVTVDKAVQDGFTVTPSYTDGTAASSGDDADYTQNTAALTFAGTANEKQTFTVATTEDGVPEEDETFTVDLSLGGTTLTVDATAKALGTITNDDTVGVAVSPTTIEVAEVDDTDTSSVKEHQGTYTVVLTSQPTADVTVSVASSDASAATVDLSTLTFTSTNWNIPQTVTVTGQDDNVHNTGGSRSVTVTHAVSGTGSGYESATADSVDVTVTDDDAAPTAVTLTVDTDSATTGSQDSVSEAAAATTVTVTATLGGSTTFAANKTVTVKVGADADSATEGTDYANVADFTITINAGSSSGSETFTLTPTNDVIDEANETLSVGGSSAGLSVTGDTVTITDNDNVIADSRIVEVTISKTAVTVAEADDTGTPSVKEHQDTYTVVLTSQPTADVTVSVTSSDRLIATVDRSALTFTSANWSMAQTVTVTGVNDDVDNARDSRNATVIHVVSGTGSGYEGVTAAAVNVTVTDDDTTPTIGGIVNNGPTVSLSCNPCVTPPRGKIRLIATARDPDGDPLTYAWDATSGELSKTGTSSKSWTAPDSPGEVIVSVTVSDGRGGTASAAVLIRIDNQAPLNPWLARFSRTAADHVVSAADERLAWPHRTGFEGQIAGHTLGGKPPQWPQSGDHGRQAGLDGTITTGDFLRGTSFTLTKGNKEEGFDTMWGRGAVSRFEGRSGPYALDGEVVSTLIGADSSSRQSAEGVMVAHSRGKGGWRSSGDGGTIEGTVTGVYRYGRRQASERISAWGVAGYGMGDLSFMSEGGGKTEMGMNLMLAAAGLRGKLLEASANGGAELALKADGLVVHTSSDAAPDMAAAAKADVTRLRVGVEGAWHGLDLAGGQLAPSLEIGLRHDSGDAETGFGADIGAGAAWSDPKRGLSVELRARGLLTHEDMDFREYGFSGDLVWDPSPSSARGPSLMLRHTAGGPAEGGMDTLLTRHTLAGLAVNDGAGRQQLEAQLGYGVPALNGQLTATPEIGIALSNSGRDYTLGWRLTPEQRGLPAFEFRIGAVRRESDSEPEHSINFQLSIRW